MHSALIVLAYQGITYLTEPANLKIIGIFAIPALFVILEGYTAGRSLLQQFYHLAILYISLTLLCVSMHMFWNSPQKEYAARPLLDENVPSPAITYKASHVLGEYFPDNLGDMKATSFWHVPEHVEGIWVELDYGPNSNFAANALSARPRRDGPAQFWKTAWLEGSADSVGFEKIADVNQQICPPNGEGWIRWSFKNEQPYRYYRVWITSGHSGEGIGREFVSLADLVLAHHKPEVPWKGLLIGWLAGISVLIAGNSLPLPKGVSLAGLSETKYFRNVASKIKESLAWLTTGRHSQGQYGKEIFFLSLVLLCYLIPLKDVLITQQKTFCSDAVTDYGAYHCFIESLWNGYWPLWNPYLHAGEPFYYDWVRLTLLDPSLLLTTMCLKLFHLSIYAAFHYIHILRTLILVLGAYLLFRRIFTYALSTFISLLILLLGNMTSLSFTNHFYLDSFLWFPWIMYFIIRLVEGGGVREIALIAFLLGISSGTVRYQFPLMLLALTVFAGTMFINQKERVMEALHRQKSLHLGLCLLLVVCLCTPVLSLLWEVNKIHTFSAMQDVRPLVDDKIKILHPDIVSIACEPILHIERIFLPLRKLTPRDDLLTGIIPVLLLWVGLLFGRNRFKINFTILIIIMALVTVGCHTVMLLLTKLLFPPMQFAGYVSLSVSFVLFMSGVFAGLGVDAIVSIINRNTPCQVHKEEGSDHRAHYDFSDARNFILQWNSSIKPFIALFLTLTFITLNQYYLKQNPNITHDQDYLKLRQNLNFSNSNILSAALISLLITFVAYLFVKLGFFFSQYISRVSWKETCKGMYQGLWIAVPSISNWKIGVISFLTHFKAATLFRIAGVCLMVFTISLPFVYEIAELPSNYLLWILYLECLFLAGISVYYLARGLEISVSKGLLVILLIGVCVEMSIVYLRCRQHYFRPSLNLGTNAFAQKPQLSNRIPWLKIDRMGGYHYGPNIYNVYTAIDEILPPKGETKFNWEDISYVKAYGWRDTIGKLHWFWLKHYLQLYEVGENNLEAFEVLMGLKSGQTLLDFYPQAIVKGDDETKEILTLPYEKIGHVLESAVFISEPLPEVFRSLQVEMSHLNPLKARPGFEYKVLKYNPNHLEIEVNTSEDGLLHYRDGYDDYWQAFVDGKQTKVYRSNLAFKAAPLKKGRHVVVFDYHPVYFMFAFRLYLLAMGGFFIFMFYDFVRYLRSWQSLQRS